MLKFNAHQANITLILFNLHDLIALQVGIAHKQIQLLNLPVQQVHIVLLPKQLQPHVLPEHMDQEKDLSS